MKKIRVGAVSYLNTRPLMYGFRQGFAQETINLIEDYPARIAQKLMDDEVDVGLIPVAVTRYMKEWHIAADYCIGCTGPVASVCLFSEVPMDQIENVYLDYQSRTSVMLCRLLLRDYWKKEVTFLQASSEAYRDAIKGRTAGLVIGDRALDQRRRSKYIYDLGEAWVQHTGLPFVFAAWISNKPLPETFRRELNAANRFGLEHIDEVVAQNSYERYDLRKYFTQDISYNLDARKMKGLHHFLEKLKSFSS